MYVGIMIAFLVFVLVLIFLFALFLLKTTLYNVLSQLIDEGFKCTSKTLKIYI